MKKTHEKRQIQANAAKPGRKRSFLAVCGAGIVAIVFFLGYTASRDTLRITKRRPIPSQQPKEVLRVALCQYSTPAESLEWNLQHAVTWAEEAFEQGAQYVILPEFSFSGFSELCRLNELIAEFNEISGEETLKQVARRHNGYLQYNHPALTDNVFWNETVLLGPDGTVLTRYHKRYLAKMDQHFNFGKGRTPLVVELPFGSVAFLICRDVVEATIVEQGLRAESTERERTHYENACKNLEQYRQADLVVGQLAFASWWTPTRTTLVVDPITDSLSRMGFEADLWARQTRTHVMLVNKSGFGHEHSFTGGSLLVDPDGNILGQAASGNEILYVDLPLDETGRIARPH